MSNYEQRIQQEIERYKLVENIHDLPEIAHYWADKYLSPTLKTLGFNDVYDVFFHYMKNACSNKTNETCRFVSIGAGNCEVEVTLSKRLISNGYTNFIFECLDINPSMLKRGKNSALNNEVLTNMEFKVQDLNYWDVDYKYDVVLALQCLHHFVELEIIFDKIYSLLDDKGFFLTQDMIGKNGHMRWPETLKIVKELWKELDDKYKYNQQLKRLETEFLDWDCSKQGFEGIRAQDILPLLVEKFNFELFVFWGGVIDVFIDRGFGHNFDINSEFDKKFIDLVEYINTSEIQKGNIKPTQTISAMTKFVPERKYYLYGLSPESCVRNTN